jgi:HEAT repeat protein
MAEMTGIVGNSTGVAAQRAPLIVAPGGELSRLIDDLARARGADWQTKFRRIVELKQQAAIPGLLALLTTAEPQYADSLAQAIATIGGPEACPGLMRVVRESNSPEVRLAAVYGLTWLLDQQAFALLLDLFGDERQSIDLRAQAGEGLTYLAGQFDSGTPDWHTAAAAFLDGLAYAAPELLRWSIYALGSLGVDSAVERLQALAARPGLSEELLAEIDDSIALLG